MTGVQTCALPIDCPQLAKYGDKGGDQKAKRQQRQERKTLVASREAELKDKLKSLKKVKAYIVEHDASSEAESDDDTDELDENALVCQEEDYDHEFEDELCLMGLEDPVVQSNYSSSESNFSFNEVFSKVNTEELCQKIQILSGSLVESLDASSILVSENKKHRVGCAGCFLLHCRPQAPNLTWTLDKAT